MMSDYVISQKNISATFDSSVEVVTKKGQKIQFNSSGQIVVEPGLRTPPARMPERLADDGNLMREVANAGAG